MTASLRDIIDPRRTALMVIDLQHDFLDSLPPPGAAEILRGVKEMLRSARRAGVRVVYTQVFVTDLTNSPVWLDGLRRRPHRDDFCRPGLPGAEIHPEVAPAPGDVVIAKYRYDAFIGTNMDLILRSQRIESLVFTGIATNVCVESTVRHGYQRDYWTVTVSDCTAATAPELHQASLRAIERNFGFVATAAEIMRIWDAAGI